MTPLFPATGHADRLRTVLKHLAATLLCVWLCLLLHIPNYNTGGGEGVWLPWNMLAWAVAVTVMLLAVLMVPAGRPVITPAARLLFLAVALMTLPVMWCPHPEWIIYSLPRLYGLWGGALFYLALLQCRFSDRAKRLFLWCITLAALVQGLTVLAGLYCPTQLSALSQAFLKTGGRQSLGIFQQVNVTASFLATGLALALALFYRECLRRAARLNHVPASRLFSLKAAYLLILMTVLPCVLVLTRSRIGWLGGLTVCLTAVVTAVLTARRVRGLSVACPVAMLLFPLAGILVGLLLMNCSVAQAIDHGGSNHQRWLTLEVSWEMIHQHPWAGWGTGSFMMQFQNYIATYRHPNPSRELMGHPHNEILYVWMEGGLVSLAGLMAIGGAVVMLLKKNGSPARRLMAVAMLPVLLHTMVEYPLYLSVPHALILLLVALNLDRCGLRAGSAGTEQRVGRVQKMAVAGLRCVLIAGCIWMLCSLHQAYRLNVLLSRFEVGELPSSRSITAEEVPWMLRTRYEADRLNMELEAYSRNGDLRLLHDYALRNAGWLRTHTDPDNYAVQTDVLRYLHRDMEACQYVREAKQLFPGDGRFDEKKCE
ncbi:O-antigen ligase family protein [Enterobacter cancerogenus]|uniref:O-antigen ligase family protein n=1 Tax=Enterobacter cancerogenus TaxID=69218 RepID=UPI004059FFA1